MRSRLFNGIREFRRLLSVLVMATAIVLAPASGFSELTVDPLNGSDRNDGRNAPVRSKRLLTHPYRPEPPERVTPLQYGQPQTTGNHRSRHTEPPKMDRIVLGAERITSWRAIDRPPIWTTGLERKPTRVQCNATELTMGCDRDLLEDGSWIWDPEKGRLYIGHDAGNPDRTGSIITAHFSTPPVSVVVSGWTRAPAAIWQTPMQEAPQNLYVDGTLFDNWWWGTIHVCDVEIGEPNTLYFRDSAGHPNNTSKIVTIVEKAGGWSLASGDFNGDGRIDAVHSNFGPEVFVNYGRKTFSSLPDQILEDPEGDSILGFYIASAGDIDNNGCDDLIVSMNWENNKVYLYMGTPLGLNDTPDIILRPPQGYPEYGFGHNVSTAGDINGDGYSDLLIAGGDGANVFVYQGSQAGVRSEPDRVLFYATERVANVSCAGDLNGDGLDDIAVCLSIESPENVFRIAIFFGTVEGLDPSPQTLTLNLPPGKSYIAGQVSQGGDINADGYDDLLIGNQWAQNAYENEGEVYLFLGSASGLSTTADSTLQNPHPDFNIRFGSAVDGIGDFNGDGFDDIIVGCPYAPATNGFAAVYTGGPDGIGATPLMILHESENFGWSVSHAGDILGNGQNFILVGEEFGDAYLYAFPVMTTETLLDFFNQSVANDTLSGTGTGVAAQIRLTLFGIILYSAQRHLNDGQTEIACWLLETAVKACDQSPTPPDLVTGPAAQQLSKMLVDLKEAISCNVNECSSRIQELSSGAQGSDSRRLREEEVQTLAVRNPRLTRNMEDYGLHMD